MKQNIYDNQTFFEQYSKMTRSQQGLEAAGEWHQLRKLLPAAQAQQVLDLGCGYGWHAKYLADDGASEVIAVDISSKMIATAKQLNNHPVIDYRRAAIEELKFADNRFDLIISSLTLHYIADYEQLISNVYNWLRDGGKFIFSCEHPIFTATENQDWEYDQNGQISHFAVDNYSYQGVRNTEFLGTMMVKYHRTIATYCNTLIEAGFKLDAIIEPTPPESMQSMPGMKNELRRPMMLIIAVSK